MQLFDKSLIISKDLAGIDFGLQYQGTSLNTDNQGKKAIVNESNSDS